MPFYSSYTTYGKLINNLKFIIDSQRLSSFKLSKLADLSPTTTRKVYYDTKYIPSPDVIERICLTLNIVPGDLLKIVPTIEESVAVCSGVFASGL
jgi:DNA-binding Xre family transcriptional regulator